MEDRWLPADLYLVVEMGIMDIWKMVDICNFYAWKQIGKFVLNFTNHDANSIFIGKSTSTWFSKDPITETSTYIKILKIANTNMTVFGYLGSTALLLKYEGPGLQIGNF